MLHFTAPGNLNPLLEEIVDIEKPLTFTRDITRFPETHPGEEMPFVSGCAGNRVPDLRR